jgi:hypothetical protein
MGKWGIIECLAEITQVYPGLMALKSSKTMGSGEKWSAAMPDSTADPALQTPDELYGVEGAAPGVNYLMHQVFCPAQKKPNKIYSKEKMGVISTDRLHDKGARIQFIYNCNESKLCYFRLNLLLNKVKIFFLIEEVYLFNFET